MQAAIAYIYADWLSKYALDSLLSSPDSLQNSIPYIPFSLRLNIAPSSKEIVFALHVGNLISYANSAAVNKNKNPGKLKYFVTKDKFTSDSSLLQSTLRLFNFQNYVLHP